ncbi:MAG: hypothetical protein Q7J12_00150 [Syntrophales bacterium]|nr:hypothetical protein [Syntrophales bacterium]
MDEFCTWTEDEDGEWATECDNIWPWSRPEPELSGMLFCCFCGLPLKQVAHEEEV